MSFMNLKRLISACSLASVVGCWKAPDPRLEAIRIPASSSSSVSVSELEMVDFVSVGAVPDPMFNQDRLNPGRYKQGTILITCLGNCPRAMVIDQSRSKVTWQTTSDDAGVYVFDMVASLGRNASKNSVTLTVKDVDRGPSLLGGSQELTVNETDEVSALLNLVDLDGDLVEVSCASCPTGIRFEEGRLKWQTKYGDKGIKVFDLLLRSKPETRPVHTLESESSTVIDRTLYAEGSAKIIVHVVKKDRPPVITAGGRTISVFENKTASMNIQAEDPDGDGFLFEIPSTSPPFVVISPSGELSISPTYKDAGSYTIDVLLMQNLKTLGTTSVVITVINVNRPPVYSGAPLVFDAKEGTSSFLNFAKAEDPDLEDKLIYTCEIACPKGMTLTTEGQASYLPDFKSSGIVTMSVSASDGQYRVSIPATIYVAETNRAPFFAPSISSMEMNALFTTTYTFYADDKDNEDLGRLRFACVACPSGLTLNAFSGTMIWTPAPDQVGLFAMKISVSDQRSIDPQSTVMDVALTVNLVDSAPKFTVGAFYAGIEESPVGTRDRDGNFKPLQIQASDVDGDKVVYGCRTSKGPKDLSPVDGCITGMTLDTATGQIIWTPRSGDRGTYAAVFVATSLPKWSVDPVDAKITTLNFKFLIRKLNHIPVLNPMTVSNFELNEQSHASTSYLSEIIGDGLHFSLSATDSDSDPLVFKCENCPVNLIVGATTGDVSWNPGYDQAQTNDAPYGPLRFYATDNDDDPATGIVSRVYYEPVSILVHNVNRPPAITVNPLANYSVFEGGHTDATFASPVGAPAVVGATAVDPDGETLTYTCFSGCIDGMVLSSGLGSFVWTPTYDYVIGRSLEKSTGEIILKATDMGGLSVTFTPFSVLVVNVNRPPVITLSPTGLSGFENGHRTIGAFVNNVWIDSATDLPMTMTATASDPDGDDISFACERNCPEGMIVSESTGALFFRPNYCSPDDALSCDNRSSGPLNGALKGNKTRPGLRISVTDFKDKTLSSSFDLTVKNYDRPPALTAGAGDEHVSEGSLLRTVISGKDPDGDTVKIACCDRPTECGGGGYSPIFKTTTACTRSQVASYDSSFATRYSWPTNNDASMGQVQGLLSLTLPSSACFDASGALVPLSASSVPLVLSLACEVMGNTWRSMADSAIFTVGSLGVKGSCQSPTLTTPSVGYCDAPSEEGVGAAPYTMNIVVSAASLIGGTGVVKTQRLAKNVYIVNVDRHDLKIEVDELNLVGAAPRRTIVKTGPIPEGGRFVGTEPFGSEQFGTVTLLQEQWPFSGKSFFDIDGLYACPSGLCPGPEDDHYPGSFRDGTYVYCDEALGPCPLGMVVQQFCDITLPSGTISGRCEYGGSTPMTDQPGCSGNAGVSGLVTGNYSGFPTRKIFDVKLSDLLWQVCPYKGAIDFLRVDHGSARIGNLPFHIPMKIVTSVHEKDFPPSEFPPEVRAIDLQLEIVNDDRAPVFRAIKDCRSSHTGNDCAILDDKVTNEPSCGNGEEARCLPTYTSSPSEGLTMPSIDPVPGSTLPVVLPGELPGYRGVNPFGQTVSVQVYEPTGNYISPGSETGLLRPTGQRDIKTFLLSAFDRDNAPALLAKSGITEETESVVTYRLLGCRATPYPATAEPDYRASPRWLTPYLAANGLPTAPFYDKDHLSWFFRCPPWIYLDKNTGVVAVSPPTNDLSLAALDISRGAQLCYPDDRQAAIASGAPFPYALIPGKGPMFCSSGYTLGNTLKDFYAVFVADACPKDTVNGADNTAWSKECKRSTNVNVDASEPNNMVIKIDVLDSDRKPSKVTMKVIKTQRNAKFDAPSATEGDSLGVDIDPRVPATMNQGNRPYRAGDAGPKTAATENNGLQEFWGVPLAYQPPGATDSKFRQYNTMNLNGPSQFVVSTGSWVDVRETDSYTVVLESSDPDLEPVFFDLVSTNSGNGAIYQAPLPEDEPVIGDDGVSYKTGCDDELKVCRQLITVRSDDRNSAANRYSSTDHDLTSMPTPAAVFGMAIRACSAASLGHPDQKNESTPIDGGYGNRTVKGDDKICSESSNPGYSEDGVKSYDAVLAANKPPLQGQRWDGYVVLSTRFHDVDRLPVLPLLNETAIFPEMHEKVNDPSDTGSGQDMCRRDKSKTYNVSFDPPSSGVKMQPAYGLISFKEYDRADQIGLDGLPKLVADLRFQNGDDLKSGHLEAYDTTQPTVSIGPNKDRYGDRNRLAISGTGKDQIISGQFYIDNWAAPTAAIGSAAHNAGAPFQATTILPLMSRLTYASGYGAATDKYTQTQKASMSILGVYVKPCFRWWVTPDYTSINDPASPYYYELIRGYILGGDVLGLERRDTIAFRTTADFDTIRSRSGSETTLSDVKGSPDSLLSKYVGGGTNLGADRGSTTSSSLGVVPNHHWLRFHGPMTGVGETTSINVHEAADGIVIILEKAIFEYGVGMGLGASNFASDPGEVGRLPIAGYISEDIGRYELKYLRFRPMWSFNYNNTLVGTRFLTTEIMQGIDIEGPVNDVNDIFRPKWMEQNVKPVRTIAARDSYEDAAFLEKNPDGITLKIMDDYIKPHLKIEDGTHLWAPKENCTWNVSAGARNCSAKRRYDAMNSEAHTGGTLNIVDTISKNFLNPNFTANSGYGDTSTLRSLDSVASFAGAPKFTYYSDGVSSFAPPLATYAHPQTSITINNSVGAFLVPRAIFGYVRREEGIYTVPGVLNFESQAFTDGSEMGLSPGKFATGSPGDPFYYAPSIINVTNSIMGYPTFRGPGTESNIRPQGIRSSCLSGTAQVVTRQSGALLFTCSNGTAVTVWWQPSEYLFTGGSGGGCSDPFSCISGN